MVSCAGGVPACAAGGRDEARTINPSVTVSCMGSSRSNPVRPAFYCMCASILRTHQWKRSHSSACHSLIVTCRLFNPGHVYCMRMQSFLKRLLTHDLPAAMALPKRLEVNIPPSVTSVAEAAVGRDTIMRAVASAVLQVRRGMWPCEPWLLT